MTFYIEPSAGNISLSLLEACAEKRLQFLTQILDIENDQMKLNNLITKNTEDCNIDGLIEGTKKDRISHFILRLALCSEKDTANFFMKAETTLFVLRLSCMTEDELFRFFRKLDLTFKTATDGSFSTSSWLYQIADAFHAILNSNSSWKYVARYYLQGCRIKYFYIPFNFALDLVAKRYVTLQRGFAVVPYCFLKEVMTELFFSHLKYGFEQAEIQRQKIIQSDSRMKKLFQKLKIQLRQKYKPYAEYSHLITNISHDQVNSEVRLFPPCMTHLHQSLLIKHRLRHHSRIQYSLFLKDIGMSAHDALMFWRKEYSKPSETNGGCTHAWKNNERRYIYNIRHLYGLEGACINYRGHCCTSLQSTVQTLGEDGGCPFKHFDDSHLKALIQSSDVNDIIDDVLALKKVNKYSEACHLFLERKLQNFQLERNLFQNDVDSSSEKVTYCDSCTDKNGNMKQNGNFSSLSIQNVKNNNFSHGNSSVCRSECLISEHLHIGSDVSKLSDRCCEVSTNNKTYITTGSRFVCQKHQCRLCTINNKSSCLNASMTVNPVHNCKHFADRDSMRNTENLMELENEQKFLESTVNLDGKEYIFAKKRKLPYVYESESSLSYDNKVSSDGINKSEMEETSHGNLVCKSKYSCGQEKTMYLYDQGETDPSCNKETNDSCDEGEVTSYDQRETNPSNFSCYNHDLCLSQLCQVDRKKNIKEKIGEACKQKVKILKPADFYFSLKKLTNGLQT